MEYITCPMLIGGELTYGSGGEWIESIDPSTEEPLGRAPAGTAGDVNAAVAAAKSAQHAWAETTIWERRDMLRQLAAAVRERAEDVARLEAADGGNTIANLGNDLFKSANQFEYFAGLISEIKGETMNTLSSGMHMSWRVPYGVVGRIVPFNHPFMFATASCAAPLAAGNCVVLKTPETSPLSAGIFAEICARVLPAGVVNIVSGYGLPVGDTIARHADVRRIGFTGSVRTGLAIQRAAAESAIKHVTLELGGKNPLIVFPDADPVKAADAAIAGMNFAWAGQSCGSTSRVLVHESLRAKVTERLVERMQAIRVGNASDPASDMGPLNSAAHRDRVQALVDIGKREATLLMGGNRPEGAQFDRGFFMAPTLFTDVTADMTIAREEAFGPVITIQSWTDEDAMIAMANGTEFGLTASLFTNDITKALRTAAAVESGVTNINGARMHFVGAPFGGIRNSGLGGEECLEELLSYTETRSVHITL
ncbi:aldehyde dehydrogenase family protein [Croceicoccus sp. Ery5]|uniref:aldehyde dehydrogenase family protein n=1 Tax=Croceicoccus sp. Ery5 TaxID=1703340 RepID=UPI001E535AC8|nr:aldehyde dehydrogenase family protein [Croceicoccus sp. Ery5]